MEIELNKRVSDFLGARVNAAIEKLYDVVIKNISDTVKTSAEVDNVKALVSETVQSKISEEQGKIDFLMTKFNTLVQAVSNDLLIKVKLEEIFDVNDYILQCLSDGSRNEKTLKNGLKKVFEAVEKNHTEKLNKDTYVRISEIKALKKEKGQSISDNLIVKLCKLGDLKLENITVDVKTEENLNKSQLAGFMTKNITYIKQTYEIGNWLATLDRAVKHISIKQTHIAKLTHSKSQSSSLRFTPLSDDKNYLSTQSLEKFEFDFTYSDAKLAPLAEFLQLEVNGQLIAEIIRDEPALFAKIQPTEIDVQQVFSSVNTSSHALSKQVYFPAQETYHLIAPMISSALAQELFKKIIAAKDAKSPIPKLATVMVTQSNHQNVSNLNGKRSGRLFLFSCQPPTWTAQAKLPTDFFTKNLAYNASEPLMQLKNLLLVIQNKKLNINLSVKKQIIDLVTELTEVVFYAAAKIQQMHDQIGWTADSSLPLYLQYWLDPYRDDLAFQEQRKNTDWSADVLYNFARWINVHVGHEKLSLGVAQEKLWQAIAKPLLREFNAVTDVNYSDLEVSA